MEKEKGLETIILEETNNSIYVADVDTYNLEYINKTLKTVLGMKSDDESYRGKKCYEVLQKGNAPCEFCTNSILNSKEFYCWEFFNSALNKNFYVQDKLIPYKGKFMRMEIAMLQDEAIKGRRKLENQLIMEKTLVECIRTLAEYEDSQSAIDRLLHIIADFYEGDRAYIFEIDEDREEIANTYEWCKTGVSVEINNLKHIPLQYIGLWMERFRTKGEFYISRLEKTSEMTEKAYHILAEQHINSLVAAPLIGNGKIRGFIGVDNPRMYYTNLRLLKSVTYFIMDNLEKCRTNKVLEHLSFHDSMTGLYNRNGYNKKLEELSEDRGGTLGVAYMDINGLKQANDEMGHGFGDLLLKKGADLMRTVFGEESYRIGGDEFVSFLSDCREEDFNRAMDELHEKIAAEEGFSASAGGSWRKNPTDVNAQLKEADGHMYYEKQKYYKTRDRRREE